MKSPGDYALMYANGMPRKDVVAAIREEAANYPPVTLTLSGDAVPTEESK